MCRIDTFIIGAQKAGTTSFYNWIGQHPEVNAPDFLKDYHFFSNPEYYKKGVSHLESFYKDVNKVNIHGAVNYMFFHQKCAARIHEYNKDANIIICLRDPIDRAISAYKYFKRTLRESETLSVALQRELNGKLSTYEELANKTYIEHGKYSKQIATFLRFFSRDKIRIIFFEDIIDKSKQVNAMKSICDFLEIDSNFKFDYSHLNASGKPKSKMLNNVIRKNRLGKFFRWLIPFQTRKKIKNKLDEINISSKKIKVCIEKNDISVLKESLMEEKLLLNEMLDLQVEEKWISSSVK